MEKVKVSFENILASLIVRFGKANVTDIKVIQDDLFNRYGVVMSPFALDYRGISNYIMKVGENYHSLGTEESKAVLEQKQGEFMKAYLENINVEDLVLLKINELGTVPDYLIPTVFCDEQDRVLSNLVDDLKVVYVWNNDVPYDDYQEVQLTFLGKARVFELQYKEQVDEFRELLRSSDYDVSLIPEFLRTQDFDRDVYDILNLDNFLYFCSKYDRAAKVDKTVGDVLKKN